MPDDNGQAHAVFSSTMQNTLSLILEVFLSTQKLCISWSFPIQAVIKPDPAKELMQTHKVEGMCVCVCGGGLCGIIL